MGSERRWEEGQAVVASEVGSIEAHLRGEDDHEPDEVDREQHEQRRPLVEYILRRELVPLTWR